jgi:SET domain-containing protein
MSRKSFRVGKSKTGLGLFAVREIKKGEFIVQYRGEKLRNEEADRRADRGNKYLYEINSRWTIDGKSRKNVARYANHSCRPNAESDVLRGHKIIIRAIKKILPGEEILYDYGKDYFNLILKPMGCRCEKCAEKRRLERAEKRLKLKRKRARDAKKAAEALELAAARARKMKAKAGGGALRLVKDGAKTARRSQAAEPQRKAA